MALRIVSFNCKGIASSVVEVRKLCERSDIVFLQETWLAKQNHYILDSIHPDFHSRGEYSVDLQSGPLVGRPFGGVAVLYRKEIAKYVTKISLEDDRLIGINFIDDRKSHWIFIGIYLPFYCSENLHPFLESLGKLKSIRDSMDSGHVMFLGDWNADPLKPFGREVAAFCEDEGLIISDQVILASTSNDVFTFYSEAHGSTSWLDHVVSTHAAHRAIETLSVDHSFISSDHFPLFVTVSTSLTASVNPISMESFSTRNLLRPLWERASEIELLCYKANSDKLLKEIYLPVSTLRCSTKSCNNVNHLNEINLLYNDIVGALTTAAKMSVSHRDKSAKNQPYKVIPGWNDYVRDAHNIARICFLTWVRAGKPRSGPLFNEMCQTRSYFKYSFREARRHEQNVSADKMALSLASGDSKTFWGVAKSRKGQSHCQNLPNNVDGCTGENAICSYWEASYKTLFNPDIAAKRVTSDGLSDETLSSQDYGRCSNMFSVEHIAKSIQSLKSGKAGGPDGLQPEHLLRANGRILPLLSMLFESMLCHSHVPPLMRKSTIVPVVKNKQGDATSSSNYRPVSLASVTSKLFEFCILSVLKKSCHISDNQFGFQSGLSCESNVYLLKEVISHYTKRGSRVYCAFLDASKAFDRISHKRLFSVLLAEGAPISIVRLLRAWYAGQEVNVRWGSTISNCFSIGQGVRQGSVLAPFLFNIYMKEMSTRLNAVAAGCFIGGQILNHILYADDLVLISPSVPGLRKLLHVCEHFAQTAGLVFNPKKSAAIQFVSSARKYIEPPSLFLNDCMLRYVDSFKYLGCALKSDCSDTTEMHSKLRAFYATSNSLVTLFSACSISVKVTLFKTYCYSVYLSSLWSKYPLYELNRWRVAYNNSVRKFFRLPRDGSITNSLCDLGLKSFDNLLRNSRSSLRLRLLKCTNVFISSIISSDMYMTSPFWQQFRKRL